MKNLTPKWGTIHSQKLLIFIILITINIVLKIPYFDIPINRDTGTFLYGGQEILRGRTPYVDFLDTKPPMVYYFAAGLIYLFGNSIFYMRLFTLITVIISSLLIYEIGKRLTNSKIIGFFSALIYSLFVSMPYSWSFEFMTTNLMEVFGLSSIYLATRFKNGIGLFFSGALVSISALSKQPGALFFLIVIFLILINVHSFQLKDINRWRKLLSQLIYFISGSLLVIIIFVIILDSHDIFWQFFNWVVRQNFITYAGGNESIIAGIIAKININVISSKISIFLLYHLPDNFLLYTIAIIEILFFLKIRKENFDKSILSFCLFWIASFGLFFIQATHFQPHYFYSLIAPLSITSAFFFERLYLKNRKIFKYIFILFIVVFLINYQNQVGKFKYEVVKVHTGVDYQTQLRVADDIIQSTKYNQKVLVLFSSPEYYFLSDREAITNYPQFNINYLSDNDKMSVIRNLISNHSPQVIIIRKNDWGSSEDIIKYIKKDYELFQSYENYDKIEIYRKN